MNHFFQNITWLHYAELLVLALLAYYLYVGLRWYRAEIIRLFKISGPSQAAGLPVQPLVQISDAQDAEAGPMSVEAESLDNSDMLTTSLLATIAESSSGACAPSATMEKLKAILSHYPQLRNSPRRTAINRLLVAECKKTALPSYLKKWLMVGGRYSRRAASGSFPLPPWGTLSGYLKVY